jgi:hypothetical protein
MTKITDPNCLALSLINILKNKDWILWEGETIAREVELTTGETLNRANYNKLMAIRTVLTNDAVWEEWELFLAVVLGLNGYSPSELIHAPQIHELWLAIEQINLLREQSFAERDSEVPRFVAAIFLHENVHYCPPPLEFAQLWVANLEYRCEKCNNKGSATSSFEWCCKDCKSEDIKVYYEYDYSAQKKIFNDLKDKEEIYIPEEAEHIAAGKLILAYKYVNYKLKELTK